MTNMVRGSEEAVAAISRWLTERIARELGVEQQSVRPDAQFSDLGLGSRQAILLTGDLEEYLGLDEIEPSLMWDFPTIHSLARHVATQLLAS